MTEAEYGAAWRALAHNEGHRQGVPYTLQANCGKKQGDRTQLQRTVTEAEVVDLFLAGATVRQAVGEINQRHGLTVTTDNMMTFLKQHGHTARGLQQKGRDMRRAAE